MAEKIKYSASVGGAHIFDKHTEIGNKWDRTFLARGYYVSMVGNSTEDTIKRYNKNNKKSQNKKRKACRSLLKRQMITVL